MKSDKPMRKYILPFLEYCEVEKGLSNNTQRNYQQYLKLFTVWLKHIREENLLPHKLTPDHIWNYRLYLARTHKSPTGKLLAKKSQNYYLIALRVFLDFLADRDIESLPSSKVKLAKQKTTESISFLEVRDVEKMLAVPDIDTSGGLRDRTIMELFFSSGMRISELIALNVDQMSFLDDKKTDRTYELSIVGKGSYVRTIFISPRAAKFLRKYILLRHNDMYKPLFINFRSKSADSKRLSSRYIQKMISKSALLAGLSKRVTPHTLRHTYATDLLSHGADLRSVQELLGHKNVSTTQVYTHVTNKQLRDIHEKFHGGGDIKDKSL
ncbi:tyrosine-type recombinase/integrase [Patescibacteria group bacterium]|nr:tyrosine-type recombinase/integrase [Patescibacteria group bacterium]